MEVGRIPGQSRQPFVTGWVPTAILRIGTQNRGKRFSPISFSSSCASWRSVSCFLTRAALNSAV
jgi:hypothetical protein